MEKKLIVAMALSFLVLMMFQKMNKPVPQQAPIMAEQPVQAAVATSSAIIDSAPSVVHKLDLEENDAIVETETLTLTFSDIGGSLREISLKDYVSDGKEEILLKTANPSERVFALRSSSIAGLDQKKFNVEKGENYLKYTFTEDGQLEIVKRYDFHKASDYIELSVFIKNLSKKEKPLSFNMTGPSELQKSGGMAGRSFLEASAMIDKELVRVKKTKGVQQRTGLVEWIALKNRYFTMVLRPEIEPVGTIFFKTTAENSLETGIISDNLNLRPGETTEGSYLLYTGPINEQRLIAFGGYDIQKLVDYGFFGVVSKALLTTLRFFHKLTKNWGLAIILLTVLINAILFPLTKKSFTSMHQMKKVQPHMAKLKELHKDNPQKLNKEMMELYKKYNVNPLGGCLPLILQMPIFISLYQGLMRSVELKGATFLWIKDLARPDAVPLPFSLPVIGASINVLPLLMAGMMVVQQKLTQGASSEGVSPDQASQQKMMMVFMPILFGFMFYNMPAGLVLYWLTNTILMSAEQGFIAKQLARS